jgi:phage gpG-like protein
LIRVRIENAERLQARFNRLPPTTEKLIGDAVKTGALELQGEIRRRISRGSRSGRIYKRGAKGEHQASAPGEYPKTDFGGLVQSIFVQMQDRNLDASVGTDLKYGTHLEFGTSKMAARPWLFPTFEDLKPRIIRRVAMALDQALNQVSGGV